jgi:hypothetical protein
MNKQILGIACLAAFVVLFFSPYLFIGASLYDVDLRHFQSPVKWFLFKNSADVIFPLWAEGISCGYPIHAYGEGGLLYPFNWLVYPFLNIPIAHDITIIIHLVLAGTGIFLLSRNYHSETMASVISAVVYMFSGYMCVHMGHLNSIQVTAWIPWAFLSLDINRYSMRPSSVFWLGLCIAMMFLAGRTQLAFYAWVALAIRAIMRSLRRPRSFSHLLVFGAGTVLGLALAAVQILPTLELVSYSDRIHGLEYRHQLAGTVSFHQLLWIVAPLWQKDDIYNVSAESIGYIGMAAGLLLLLSSSNFRSRSYRGWVVLFFLTLLFSMGQSFPLNAFIYQMPGFAYFRSPARWLGLMTFAASMLVGYGAENMMRWVRGERNKGLLAGLILLTVFCDLYYFTRPVVSFLDREAQNAVPNAVPILKKGGRYIALDTVPIFKPEIERLRISPEKLPLYFSARETLNENLGMLYGLKSVASYTGLHLKWNDEALFPMTPERLSEMNCEFIICRDPLKIPPLREIYRNTFFHIYRNGDVQPRVRLVASMIQNGADGFISKGSIKGSSRFVDQGDAQHFKIEIQAEESGYLILADSFYPGWKALIEGKAVEIRRTNGWMRAIPLPAGRSIVTFVYRPASFTWGLAVSCAAVLFLLIFMAMRRYIISQ